MKLLKNQKAFLKTIKNDKARAEQKTQFKLQNKFDRNGVEIIFTDGQFKTDDPRVMGFLNSTSMFCNKVDEPKEESKSDFDTMQWGDRKEPENPTKETWYENQCKTAEEKFKETDKMIQDHLEKIWLDKHSLKSKTLTKEALRDLTEPITKKTIKSEQLTDKTKPKGRSIELSEVYLESVLSGNPSLDLVRSLKELCVKHQEYVLSARFRDKEKELEKLVETAQVKEESVAKKVIAERLESTKATETVELKIYTKGDMKKCFWNSRNLLNDVRETIWEYQNFEQYLKSLK